MHVYCGFWFNEVEVTPGSDEVSGLGALKKYTPGLCAICKENAGCKVKCAMQNCTEVMHPICAKDCPQTHVLLLAGMRTLFCSKHSKPFMLSQ
jgi:hypothetical protein